MAATLFVAWAPSPIPAGTKIIVEATAPLSAGIHRPQRSRYKVIRILTPAQVSPRNVIGDYQPVFGNPVAGRKIFVRLTIVSSTGLTSARFLAVGVST